ncbi:MAG TPA: hypothetical protein V6C85_17095 [Allocoleopsis sp.]
MSQPKSVVSVKPDTNYQPHVNGCHESGEKMTKTRSADSTAMTLVLKHLSMRPHTCSSLVKTIGTYSSSHISRCLRKLEKARIVYAVWDSKLVSLVYYSSQPSSTTNV